MELKITILSLVLVLYGCNTVPVKPTFPTPPVELMVPPPPLKTINKSGVPQEKPNATR